MAFLTKGFVGQRKRGSNPHVLMVFQNSKLYDGTNNAYLRMGQALQEMFEIYYAVPDRGEVYVHGLSASQKQRCYTLPRQWPLTERWKRFVTLWMVIREKRIGIVMHSYNFDVPSVILIKWLTGVKLVYYFGQARMGWKMRCF